MINSVVKATLLIGISALVAIPAESRSTTVESRAPELVGPREDEIELDRVERLRDLAFAPDIDFREPVSALNEAILRAYWHNPEVLAERARKRSADFRLPQARAQYGPQVDYQFGYSYRRDRIELQPDRFRSASGWTSTISAIIDQPLLTFGRLAANERRAQAEIGFERSTLEYTEQQIIFAAIEAYVAVIRDRNGVRIAQENLDLLASTLRESEQRLNAHETTIVDLRQVETRRRLAAAEFTEATGRLATSESRFLAVVGSPPGQELASPEPLNQPVPTLNGALKIGLSQNPLVKAAHYREQISRAAAEAAVAERMPRIDLRARADLAPVNAYDDQLQQTTYLGQLVLSGPLFTSGLLAARQKEAEAINDADWRLIDAARRNLIDELTSAWKTHEASGQSFESYDAAVDAAREAHAGAEKQQKAGFRTILDVLILARDLLTVENGLNNAQYENYIAQTRILFALGMLNLSDVLPQQPSYNAEAHLESVDGQGSVLPITPLIRVLDGARNIPPEAREARDPAVPFNSPPQLIGDDKSQ